MCAIEPLHIQAVLMQLDIFADSLLLSLVAMLFAAAYIYLPNHIAHIYAHIIYYFAGDASLLADYLPTASSILRNSGTNSIEVVYETAIGGPVATAMETIAEL
jgi:hypothetical protein